MYHVYYYSFPIGKLGIVDNTKSIIAITLASELEKYHFAIEETALIKEAYRQLFDYFLGNKKNFDLPLDPQGTPFQKKCWDVLKTIPYGTTWTYKQLAKAIGNEKACRAVGNANNKNPIMIVIPCHRVIGSNGKLIGYRGGITMKETLLQLENNKKEDLIP